MKGKNVFVALPFRAGIEKKNVLIAPLFRVGIIGIMDFPRFSRSEVRSRRSDIRKSEIRNYNEEDHKTNDCCNDTDCL
jgi:hypothetical protein